MKKKKTKKKRNTKRRRRAPIRPRPKPKEPENSLSGQKPILFLRGLMRSEAGVERKGWMPELGRYVFSELGIREHMWLLMGPCYLSSLATDEEGLLVSVKFLVSGTLGGGCRPHLGSIVVKRNIEELKTALGLFEPGPDLKGVTLRRALY